MLQRSLRSQKWKSLFHSTVIFQERPKYFSQEPKTHIRYSVRQKRSDGKGAVKDLLLNGVSHRQNFQGEDSNCGSGRNRHANVKNFSHESDNVRSKQQSTSKGKHGKGRRRRNFSDDDDWGHPDSKLSARSGGQRTFTWSFGSGENLRFDNATNGFEWRSNPSQNKGRRKVWSESDISDDEDVSNKAGLVVSHRVILGLPPTGALDLEEVKRAFHASALKWHPDMHQGSSQAAVAQEKFKLCADAYRYLCNDLKSR